jgi:tetratricopeptide (TPR) repeat protein
MRLHLRYTEPIAGGPSLAESSPASAALQAARRSLYQGDGPAAWSACLQIVRDCPEEAGAWHLLGVLALRDGERPAAEDYLRRAAEATNTTALYVLSYAELCCKLKDREAALALTRRALRLDDCMALAWFSLGAQLLDARELAEAERCLQRAAQLDAGLWQAHCRLAALPAARGDTLEAERRFTALLREAPDNALVLAEHAAFLQDLGRHDDALLQIGRAIESSPNSLDHHLRAADIEMQCGRTEAALRRLESIQHRWPNEPQQVASRAILLRLLDRHEDAIVLCREALARGVDAPDLLRAYAQALHLAGEEEAALTALDRAAAAHPGPALGDKGVLLSQRGRFVAALDAFDRALRHDPARAETWYEKASAKTFSAADPDIGAMQTLLVSGRPYRDRMLLHFALGKARFECGEIDAALAHWHEGNRMKRAAIEYDPAAASRALQAIAARPIDAVRGEITGARASELPVFVVGMPRCGSSLIEHIIASHPDAHGGGEQTRMRQIILPLENGARGEEARTAETALRSLSRCAPAATRIVDKDLMNFQHLGLIHRLFPRARIIHCRRDAMDTCFSAYGKLFAGDLPFAYELRELGLYYRDYHALMAHWRGTLPADNFMEVDYETLVSQPDETTRRLVHFLGLPWHEACGRFFETARTVNTASFVQVRQPIYRSSVGRSAALLDHLRPLVEALGPLGPGPA